MTKYYVKKHPLAKAKVFSSERKAKAHVDKLFKKGNVLTMWKKK